jgi:hypothetical protein
VISVGSFSGVAFRACLISCVLLTSLAGSALFAVRFLVTHEEVRRHEGYRFRQSDDGH